MYGREACTAWKEAILPTMVPGYTHHGTPSLLHPGYTTMVHPSCISACTPDGLRSNEAKSAWALTGRKAWVRVSLGPSDLRSVMFGVLFRAELLLLSRRIMLKIG